MWGYADFIAAGFDEAVLHPVTARFCAADQHPIGVVGAFKGIFEGIAPSGRTISCRALVYVSRSVNGFFISQDTMIQLYVIYDKFPEVGRCLGGQVTISRENAVSVGTEGLWAIGHLEHDERSCGCPRRSAVPDKPTSLPFEPHPNNIGKMNEWLRRRYASSTFNICPHRPLQEMSGPPIQIHMDGSAIPKVCHKAAPVPLHWQNKVREDLLRDEALGVIERVPCGVPMTWCHHMVVTRKQDGTPRRTVDLSPLNKYCRRESYSGESPFVLARRVTVKRGSPLATHGTDTTAFPSATVIVI